MNCARRAGWAPNGFAAIPTTAIDPPHGAVSPAVPALMGPGPRQSKNSSVAAHAAADLASTIFWNSASISAYCCVKNFTTRLFPSSLATLDYAVISAGVVQTAAIER